MRPTDRKVKQTLVAVLALASASARALCESPGTTQVAIETAHGRIVAEIYVKQAPVTATNFLRYVDAGLYRDATFYRAVRPDNDARTPKISVIQGGIDPTARRAPLPPIAHETTEKTGLRHVDGSLFMARWEPGTATSEFAILVGDNSQLDFGGARSGDGQGFAVFGRVTSGMDVVRTINAGPTQGATAIDYMKGQALTRPVAMRIERSRCEECAGDACQVSSDSHYQGMDLEAH